MQFARAWLGRQVGSGECYDLADAALQKAGARSAPAYGEITPDGDYVWGRQISLQDARPGDIVQFRDFNIVTTTLSTLHFADGRRYTTQSWVQNTRAHHTAIVEANQNGILSLLEQNTPPLGPRVQRTVLPVVSMTVDGVSPDDPEAWNRSRFDVAGYARIYRPQS